MAASGIPVRQARALLAGKLFGDGFSNPGIA
jgi:hypothetical protein